MTKKIIARLLLWTGVTGLLRRARKRRVLILYLHSVIDPSTATWTPLRTHFPLDRLRRQLAVLSRHYQWLSLDEALEVLSGEKPPVSNGVVLTFDDGYRNNMELALPVLEEYGIKPVFFVATGMLDSRTPYWFERLDYAIQQLEQPARVRIGSRSLTFTPGDREALRTTYAELRLLAKEHFDDDSEFYTFVDGVSQRLEKAAGKALADIQKDDLCSATLSKDDLANLASSGRATIGSHTVDHVRLDVVDEATCREQLQQSRKYIEEATGEACRHFCYPNGNWNALAAQAVADAGYASAVTTDVGSNAVGDDPYTLKRVHMPAIDDPAVLLLFMARVPAGNRRAKPVAAGPAT